MSHVIEWAVSVVANQSLAIFNSDHELIEQQSGAVVGDRAALRSATFTFDTAGEYEVEVFDSSTGASLGSYFVKLTGAGGTSRIYDVVGPTPEFQQLVQDSGQGSGSITHTHTVYMPDGTTPLSGAEVWISTDEAGTNVVAGTSVTDDFGNVTFLLDPGTYYRWIDHPGFQFANPAEFEVA